MGLDKCVMARIQLCSIIQRIFTALKFLCAPSVLASLPSAPDPSIASIGFPLLECHIVEVMRCVACSDWLLSLSNTHFSFLHAFSWLDSSFLFSAKSYSIVCTMVYPFTYSRVSSLLPVLCSFKISVFDP